MRIGLSENGIVVRGITDGLISGLWQFGDQSEV
jgi:hypothetical protein